MNRKLGVLLLAALFLAAPLSAQSDGSEDAVLHAMRAELARSKSRLKLPDGPAPYYISYEITDFDTVTASAEMGAMHSENQGHMRLARVLVRVGDYKQDSFYQRGLGVSVPVPLDTDEQAIRNTLWLATDSAYKLATEALTAKQARLKQLNVEEKDLDDFGRAEPVHYIGPLAKMSYDSTRWRSALRAASAVGKKDPDLQEAITQLEFHAVNRYFINSEGSEIREGQTIYSFSVTGTTQAPDGMELQRNVPLLTSNAKELPSQAELVALASKAYGSLKELRNAPVVDENYRGPTLFSGDASASIFADLVGENLLGIRPNLGESARTRGAFASNFKSRVLPDFLDVVDDPTVATVHGRALLGNYAVDQEGVKAQRVSLIEKGILLDYTMSRTPIRDFARSNGHGRARVGNSPGASLGNLFIRSNQPMSPEALKQKFLQRCKERGLPFGYYAVTLGNQRAPRLLYRVYVNDGHEELVRGAAFGDLDTRSLRSDLIAAADDEFVDNRMLAIPHSIVAPSVLFEELEIRRANKQKNKLPEYPPPVMGGK